MHAFVFDHDTDTDHVFVCAQCGVQLGFNKPELGWPNAVEVEGTWVPPANADDYVTPCTGGE